MRDIIRLLFWASVLFSVFVLARRQVQKRTGGAEEPDLDPIPEDIESTLRRIAPPMAEEQGPLFTAASPTPASRPPDVPSDAPPSGAPPPTASERQGFFAPVPEEPGPEPQHAAARPVATVAEALYGINWPCGLTPVIALDSLHLVDRQVTVSTTEAGAPEVGRRFGDALEALGFSLRSQTDTVATATRPDATLEVRLHPSAGVAQRGGVPLYPTLPPDAVVVVIDLQ